MKILEAIVLTVLVLGLVSFVIRGVLEMFGLLPCGIYSAAQYDSKSVPIHCLSNLKEFNHED